MTMTDDDRDMTLARLEAVLARIELVSGIPIAPLAPTIDGWPAPVAAGELIESAWGNAVVNGLKGAHIDGGFTRVGDHSQAATGIVMDVATPPIKSYATRMVVSATVSVGSSSQIVDGIIASINTPLPSPSGPTSSTGASPAPNRLLTVPLMFSWTVAASGSGAFNISAAWAGASNVFTAATATWERYRA